MRNFRTLSYIDTYVSNRLDSPLSNETFLFWDFSSVFAKFYENHAKTLKFRTIPYINTEIIYSIDRPLSKDTFEFGDISFVIEKFCEESPEKAWNYVQYRTSRYRDNVFNK